MKLSEEERARLSELYLRRQAILNDIGQLQRLAQAVGEEIAGELERLARERFEDPKVEMIRPVFEEYRLVGLEVPDDWEVKDGPAEAEERS